MNESRKSRINETELLSVFPEACSIIPLKIAEWEEQREALADAIRERLKAIQKLRDELSRFFWRECVKQLQVPRLLEIDRHIVRLSRLLQDPSKASLGRFTERELQSARTVPIENLLPAEQKLRKGYKTISTHCPLHADRSPSFHVYPATNTFWCFGCQQGGDAIAFVSTLKQMSFREAVEWLLKGV